MVTFHLISGLANSFYTFGLRGDVKSVEGSLTDSILSLYVDDFHKKTISDDDARKIFDLVTEAFMLGSRTEHHYCGATYEFDRDALTVVEHIDKDNRGEWL